MSNLMLHLLAAVGALCVGVLSPSTVLANSSASSSSFSANGGESWAYAVSTNESVVAETYAEGNATATASAASSTESATSTAGIFVFPEATFDGLDATLWVDLDGEWVYVDFDVEGFDLVLDFEDFISLTE